MGFGIFLALLVALLIYFFLPGFLLYVAFAFSTFQALLSKNLARLVAGIITLAILLLVYPSIEHFLENLPFELAKLMPSIAQVLIFVIASYLIASRGSWAAIAMSLYALNLGSILIYPLLKDVSPLITEVFPIPFDLIVILLNFLIAIAVYIKFPK